MTDTLSRLFEPRSIAVVGASTDPRKRGHQILLALRGSGYAGDVYPVNPRGGYIADFEVLESIEALPHGVDLAVLCTPAASAPELVRACGLRGVGGALVLAVGFGESGDAGAALEADLARAGSEAGVRIIGPNTSGLLNMASGLNVVGARGVRAGGLALLLQSGNVALALMTEVTERSWEGVSIYLGVGNQVDVGSAEALDYLETHAATCAVIAYLEAVPDARGWLATAARVGRSKPVVVIKSGRTDEGSAAARSHTGSIAGPYDRMAAALKQAGVVEVTRTDELLHVAETLGHQPTGSTGSGIAILSDGGGHGALVADQLAEAGARAARLSDETRIRLATLLGPAAATANPVDLAGASDADPMAFARAIEILLDDPGVGIVLVVGLFGGYGVRFSETLVEAETAAARAMAALASSANVGLIVHTMYAAHRTEPLAVLGQSGVPVVASLDVATRCAIELQRRAQVLESEIWDPNAVAVGVPDPGAAEVIARARRQERTVLDEVEARQVLEAYGLTFAPHREAWSAEQARQAARELEGPLVLKLISHTIVHKSDAGGVLLHVESADAGPAFEQLAAQVSAWRALHGAADEPLRAMVSSMLPSPRAELLVGGTRDPELGPVLTVGAGGIWVEAIGDVAHRVLPVSDHVLEEIYADLRIAEILSAGRGLPEVERAALVRASRAVACVLEAHPDVVEVEMNPIFVYDSDAVPVDARILLRS